MSALGRWLRKRLSGASVRFGALLAGSRQSPFGRILPFLRLASLPEMNGSHPLQPGEAWVGRAARELAVFGVPALCWVGDVSAGMVWRRRGAGGNEGAAASCERRIALR